MKIIKFCPIYCFLFFLVLTAHNEPFAHNQIKGTVKFYDCQKSINKGLGYNKDGTEIMHSDDPMSIPQNNLIISLHPLSFQPKLTLTDNAYITQKEQTFLPKVLPVTAGSKVYFLNEDEFFHNVQSYTSNARFSIGRRAPGISYGRKIKKKGVINLMCDIHTHMNAVILSLDTSYFTRIEEDGTYHIEHLPDGTYRLEIFHLNCPKIIDEITLVGGEIVTLDYDFSIRP